MTNNKKIMENSLSMPDIIKEFNTYETGKQKAKYLREMGTLNLPHKVNWENLAQSWEGTRPWPKKEDGKDESIMKDYLDPVGETNAEEKLTKQELDAIL
jgi:hypothetical protein